MAGIGKYPKGKKFELKSGNNPAFKMMAGDSPITNEFGIGKGASPYAQLADPDAQAKLMDAKTSKKAQKVIDADADADSKKDKKGKKGKKGGAMARAAEIAVAGLTSGLDAVYGSGKIVPVSFSGKKKEQTETAGQKFLREEQEKKDAEKNTNN